MIRGRWTGLQETEQPSAAETALAQESVRQSVAQNELLSVIELSKSYGSGASRVQVLGSLSLSLGKGEFISIVGPSGVGKSTLLRCLSGLTPATSGEILLHGELVIEPPLEIALVFQDYSRSLLPWLRNGANIALPLRSKGVGARERTSRVHEALEAVGLPDVADKYPWQLSGGMQQRVAIARALAYRPEIMLMDEPFAAVDAQTRLDLEDLLLKVHQGYGMSTIFVTHDIDEAVYLSDRVVVLNGKPASVAELLVIGFGRDRDQITTRAQSEFSVYRSRILRHVRRN